MINNCGIPRVFIGQKNTRLSFLDSRPLKILTDHRVTVDEPHYRFIIGVVQEHLHLIRGIMRLQDDGVSILGTMIRVEQFLTKGL